MGNRVGIGLAGMSIQQRNEFCVHNSRMREIEQGRLSSRANVYFVSNECGKSNIRNRTRDEFWKSGYRTGGERLSYCQASAKLRIQKCKTCISKLESVFF